MEQINYQVHMYVNIHRLYYVLSYRRSVSLTKHVLNNMLTPKINCMVLVDSSEELVWFSCITGAQYWLYQSN